MRYTFVKQHDYTDCAAACMARAFIKDNQFYIMDESTSNLDFAT